MYPLLINQSVIKYKPEVNPLHTFYYKQLIEQHIVKYFGENFIY